MSSASDAATYISSYSAADEQFDVFEQFTFRYSVLDLDPGGHYVAASCLAQTN